MHGERTSARRFATTLREEAYLREHWPMLRALREALRTEPSVRFAVLFGSAATGRATERSDLDVLVQLADPSAGRVAALTARLEKRLRREVQIVRLEDAERTPLLMVDALDQGRVLVDREAAWPRLQNALPAWRRRAREADVPLEDAMPDLGLDG